jgi:TolA-binding protein
VNLLVIGGLLVVAAAAIIGAVLIGISEQRAETARNASLKQPALSVSSDMATRKLVEEPALSRPNSSTTRENNLPTVGEDQRLSSLNGQFRELAGEIRTLHQQAWQLEQRLSILTEMVDHIEQTQGGRIRVEEESHPASDNTLAELSD